MTVLELREYRRRNAVELSQEQRDSLLRLLPSMSVAPSPEKENHYDLVPGSWIGSLQLPGLEVVIRPKFPMEKVLFLVSYALGGVRLHETDAHLESERSLVEAIVPGFVHQVNRALSSGVVQGYREEEASLPTVRGRILFDDQIRKRYGILPPIEVRYDDFTEDILLNRLLKAAIFRLRQLSLRSEESRRSLRRFDNVLANVELVPFAANNVPVAHYTRLNEHYRPAVELARLILRSTSYELRQGRVQATGFLVDMNRVFEDFVYESLREALRLTEREFVQQGKGKGLRLDQGGQIPLKPDLSWWRGRHCLWVGDAKYKKIEGGQVPNADLYQALAYAVATGLSGATLIYAAGERPPGTYLVRGIEKFLEVRAVDLAVSPQAILAQVGFIAQDILKGSNPVGFGRFGSLVVRNPLV